jgi:hypothetical protein
MSCRFKYIGIDPGVSGGMTVIDEEGVIRAFKCPDKVIDMSMLFDVAVGNTSADHVKFLMERVWARPNNASSRAFAFGVNYGQWLGISASADVHIHTQLPQHWIAWFGCPKGMESRDRKNWLKDKAKELYPELKKVTLATADSVLIAHYAKHSDYFKEKK